MLVFYFLFNSLLKEAVWGAQMRQSLGVMLACSSCTQSMGLGTNWGDSCRGKLRDTNTPVPARRLCLCSRARYQPRFRSSVTCVLIKALGRELFLFSGSKGGQTPSDPSSAPSFLLCRASRAGVGFMGRVGFMGLLLRWFGLWGFAALGNSLLPAPLRHGWLRVLNS